MDPEGFKKTWIRAAAKDFLVAHLSCESSVRAFERLPPHEVCSNLSGWAVRLALAVWNETEELVDV
jgi:hypothetical protein